MDRAPEPFGDRPYHSWSVQVSQGPGVIQTWMFKFLGMQQLDVSSCFLRRLPEVAFFELHLDVSVENRVEKMPEILNRTKRSKYSSSGNLPTSENHWKPIDATHLSVHWCLSFQGPRRTTILGKLIGKPSHPTWGTTSRRFLLEVKDSCPKVLEHTPSPNSLLQIVCLYHLIITQVQVAIPTRFGSFKLKHSFKKTVTLLSEPDWFFSHLSSFLAALRHYTVLFFSK